MGTHPIFESDFDCLTDHANPATIHAAKKGRTPKGYSSGETGGYKCRRWRCPPIGRDYDLGFERRAAQPYHHDQRILFRFGLHGAKSDSRGAVVGSPGLIHEHSPSTKRRGLCTVIVYTVHMHI